MNEPPCRQLEDYLAGELGRREQGEFETHLQHCAACRDEVDAQQRIDNLLRDANRQVELLSGFERLVERRVRRSDMLRTASWTAAAALVLLAALAIGWLLSGGGQRPIEQSGRIAVKPPGQQVDMELPVDPQGDPKIVGVAAPSPTPRAVVQFNNDDVIALRVETTNPTVHIYHLLPAQPLAAAARKPELP